MITITHDAEYFPWVYEDNSQESRILFDKILADVPCSGDAVMRKLPNKWRNWKKTNMSPYTIRINSNGC